MGSLDLFIVTVSDYDLLRLYVCPIWYLFLFQVTKAVLSFSSKAKKTKKDTAEKEEPMDVVITIFFLSSVF